jgi:hypothetical protein
MTSGLPGSRAMSPIEIVPWWSKIGVHVMPPLVVFQRPPEAEATYTTSGFPGTPSMSVRRPPMMAGPMFRHVRFSNSAASTPGVGGFWDQPPTLNKAPMPKIRLPAKNRCDHPIEPMDGLLGRHERCRYYPNVSPSPEVPTGRRRGRDPARSRSWTSGAGIASPPAHRPNDRTAEFRPASRILYPASCILYPASRSVSRRSPVWSALSC